MLVVDDDPLLRHLVRLNLELEGFEVVTAADGREALAMVGAHPPDVLTLDIMMPLMDGWEVLRRLRASYPDGYPRVLLLTARAEAADFARGRMLGADAYLTKPFEPAELVDTVWQLLEPYEEPPGSYQPPEPYGRY